MGLLTNMASYLEHVNKQPVDMWKGQLSKFSRFFQKLPTFLPRNVSENMILYIIYLKVFLLHEQGKETLKEKPKIVR